MSCTSDSTGRYLVGADRNSGIYVSTNSGQSWSASVSMNNIFSLSGSSNGKIITAAQNNGYLYQSTNSGQSFSTIYSSSKQWTTVAMASNGKDLFVDFILAF